ncbi:MAG: monofunctional biosynthetic peptidoglycan transglycosylase [Caldithrix sp. RBG_13_44_9]|nr:MAG: monofunctional biosynthetic peptidoglycan transglycosylase [Caldithrix sp. RBG_13_44_9]
MKKFLLLYLLSYLFLMLVFGIFLVITTPDVKDWKSKHPQKTSYMKYREKDKNYLKIRNKVFYKWIPLSQVPDLMQKTIIVSEDASFWSHEGIDWYEIRESLKKNIREGGFLRGGSTITQQVARNLYLSPEKNVGRKIREWVITKELEKSLTKSEILELYINIAEWGYNIFGINAASQYYFQKSPQELTLNEMIRLAAVLPNPLDMKPNQLKRSVLWRSKVILERLRKFEYIDAAQYEDSLSELDSLFMG